MSIAEVRETARTEDFIRSIVEDHHRDPELDIQFACWFPDPATGEIVLLEVSPGVVDPGDASFYGVTMAVPEARAGVPRIRFILTSPEEFRQAATAPASPGGEILSGLRRRQDFRVVRGASTEFARLLEP